MKLPFKLVFIQRILICLGVTVFIIYLTHSSRFSTKYNFIPNDKIEDHLLYQRTANSCPALPNHSQEMLDVEVVEDFNHTQFGLEYNIKLGGLWRPDKCVPVHNVALVIPYRGRHKQLNAFLHHIHPFLQKQLINYRIFIVEQTYNNKKFNRGKLMNVGYKEAMKQYEYDCFIFHDVDLLPQVESNIYGCTRNPRHMSASINVWRYNLLYEGAFGGVISMLGKQFAHVNGYSNLYFGWGGEDDDLLKRVLINQLGMCRFSPEISRYYMLHHKPEDKNPERGTILQGTVERYHTDGLNSLAYQVMLYQDEPLYTHLVVDI